MVERATRSDQVLKRNKSAKMTSLLIAVLILYDKKLTQVFDNDSLHQLTRHKLILNLRPLIFYLHKLRKAFNTRSFYGDPKALSTQYKLPYKKLNFITACQLKGGTFQSLMFNGGSYSKY